MGSCWNTPLPPENDYGKRKSTLGHYGAPMFMPQAATKTGTANPGTEFGREESRLKELFTALRTGLLFSPTEFSVLPGISTTAKVRFTLGNSELQRLHDGEDEEDQDEGLPEAVVLTEEGDVADSDSENETEPKQKEDPFPFQVTLNSKSWAKELTMRLVIWPVVGPFVDRKLVFVWSGNLLKVQGCKAEELNARLLPVSFENETDFCKCCLLLIYQTSQGNLSMQVEERVTEESEHGNENDGESVASLKSLAYKTAVSNLDTVPNVYSIPSKVYHQFFGSQSPVLLSVKIWPSTSASQFEASSTMKVKSNILFSEYVYLLREHFKIPTSSIIKLYHNFKLIQMTDLVTEKYHDLDCFVVGYNNPGALSGSYTSLDEETQEDTNVTLVTSLVGKSMQNMEVDLEMTMRDFDRQLRRRFDLRDDSFLFIIAEDDFSPQYTADDNWKCTYPFNVPDNSFSAGIRRSFKRLSVRRAGASRLTQSQRFQRSSNLDSNNAFAPHMAEVLKFLSSEERHFPSNSGKYSMSVKELYSSMPMYQMSIEQCGIHPYSIIQVFEVTGPSIPITVRLISDYNQVTNDPLRQQAATARTCLANIMDINPDWSIQTFLQYVDAIISPGTGSRRKRLLLDANVLEDSSKELVDLSIGELLNSWRPAWWPLEGTRRAQLTARDIEPSEFLLIEKY